MIIILVLTIDKKLKKEWTVLLEKLWETAHPKDKLGYKYNAILEYTTTIL